MCWRPLVSVSAIVRSARSSRPANFATGAHAMHATLTSFATHQTGIGATAVIPDDSPNYLGLI